MISPLSTYCLKLLKLYSQHYSIFVILNKIAFVPYNGLKGFQITYISLAFRILQNPSVQKEVSL